MAKVQYAQSPEERRIARMLIPILTKAYKRSGEGKDLYKVPKLKINTPNIRAYTPGGKEYKRVEKEMAPAFWQSYDANVQNPLINRFAAAGQLGSPLGGASGAGMDALAQKRGEAEKNISAQVYQAAQTPMLAAYGAETQAAMKKALTPYEYTQQMRQYPYQILPGILGGTLPETVVQQPTSGGK